jgi:hypothetical protein
LDDGQKNHRRATTAGPAAVLVLAFFIDAARPRTDALDEFMIHNILAIDV